MKKTLTALAFLGFAVLLLSCGRPLTELNTLAAGGSINANAPVTAQVMIQINANPGKVWALLADPNGWPKWNSQIESVSAPARLDKGVEFTWKTGGSPVHSRVQLFEPQRRLAWTGTVFTAKAIHVWELSEQPQNQTLVVVKESMDGPLMATLFPSRRLKEANNAWLAALKKAAESGS